MRDAGVGGENNMSAPEKLIAKRYCDGCRVFGLYAADQQRAENTQLLAKGLSEDDAAEIVRRYNAFEDLLAACKESRQWISNEYVGADSVCDTLGINAAIAAAEKEE